MLGEGVGSSLKIIRRALPELVARSLRGARIAPDIARTEPPDLRPARSLPRRTHRIGKTRGRSRPLISSSVSDRHGAPLPSATTRQCAGLPPTVGQSGSSSAACRDVRSQARTPQVLLHALVSAREHAHGMFERGTDRADLLLLLELLQSDRSGLDQRELRAEMLDQLSALGRPRLLTGGRRHQRSAG